MKTMQSIIEKSNLTYSANEEIIKPIIAKLKHAGKSKDKYSFSQNDILNAYYDNELLRYKEFNKLFFQGILKDHFEAKSDDELSNIIIKSVMFLNSVQKGLIDFPKTYGAFAQILEEYYNPDAEDGKNTFLRAMFDDINVVFNSINGGNGSDEFIRDDSMELYNIYFTNTLFRNYVVIFSEELLRVFPYKPIEAFVLDILSNNRKIHTLIKPSAPAKSKNSPAGEYKETKKFLHEISSETLQKNKEEAFLKYCQDQAENEVADLGKEYDIPEKYFKEMIEIYKQEKVEKALNCFDFVNQDERESKKKDILKEIEAEGVIIPKESKRRLFVQVLKNELLGKGCKFNLVHMILLSLKKKLSVRGASIFSNQLKTFFLKRQKFLKNKEISGDANFIEHAEFVNNSQKYNKENNAQSERFIFTIKKTSAYDDLIRHIESIIGVVTNDGRYNLHSKVLGISANILSELHDENGLESQKIIDNIHQALLNAYGTNKNEYLNFIEYCIKNNKPFFQTLYYYTSDFINRLIVEKPSIYNINQEFFKSLGLNSLDE